MHLRHQMPVYSPTSLVGVGAAIAGGFGIGGDWLGELETTLREGYAANDVLLCATGTQALQVAIQHATSERGPNAVVALPGFSCYDVASAAIGARVPVTLYDIDPYTLSPDLSSLRRALENGATIVIVAPLYGVPVDWYPLQE